MSKQRCTQKDSSLPQIFAKMQCFEDEGHDGDCRFHMNREEVQEFFALIDAIGKQV